MYFYCSFIFAGSGDIVGSNIKLILGLVWMLILHFQISGVGVDGDIKGKSKKVTPKQALLGYVQVRSQSKRKDMFINEICVLISVL